jgi:hypothetical protein
VTCDGSATWRPRHRGRVEFALEVPVAEPIDGEVTGQHRGEQVGGIRVDRGFRQVSRRRLIKTPLARADLCLRSGAGARPDGIIKVALGGGL